MAAATGLSGRLATRWSRLNERPRVAGVDLARGLAIIGMFAAHMFALPEIDWTDASTWGSVAGGRSSILFATLAGVSLALITGGTRRLAPGDLKRARRRIIVRAAIIWLIGLLLITTGVPVLVILPAYGILFLLAIPFLNLRPAALFAWAAGLALVMPFAQVLLDALPVWTTPSGALLQLVTGWAYPFPVWIAFVLCGIGIGRLDLQSWRFQVMLLTAGAAAAAIAYTLDSRSAWAAAGGPWRAVWTARAHSSGLLEVVGSGGFAVAVIGLCLLLCRTWLVWIVLPLRATGSMPLSAYTAQLLVWAVVATAALGSAGDLAGFRQLHPFVPFALGTIVGCTLWALVVGRGPLEWAVARVSSALTPPSPVRADR